MAKTGPKFRFSLQNTKKVLELIYPTPGLVFTQNLAIGMRLLENSTLKVEFSTFYGRERPKSTITGIYCQIS